MPRVLKVNKQVPNIVTEADKEAVLQLNKEEKQLLDEFRELVKLFPALQTELTAVETRLEEAWGTYNIRRTQHLAGTHEEETELDFDLDKLYGIADKYENFTFGQ